MGSRADDKNGIWICLKCLEDCKMVKCAFFVQEEVECIGSSHADSQVSNSLKEVKASKTPKPKETKESKATKDVYRKYNFNIDYIIKQMNQDFSKTE